MTYKSLIAELQSDKPLTIMGHIDPDSDCICSMLAVYFAFDGAGKGWRLMLQDEIADNLRFLPGVDNIEYLQADTPLPRRLLLVDCNELHRANRLGYTDADIEELLVIDHHPPKQSNAQKLIDPKRAACCELLYNLIKKARINIDERLALVLYAGLAGDTGCFRQANTHSATLAAAADLLKRKIDTEQVRVNLFESRSAANMLVLGAALSSMELYFGNKLCFLSVSLVDKQRFNAKADDCTSIVNFALAPIGVQLGLFFEERADNTVRISLRSRGDYEVRSIAQAFGGGGHTLAAGAAVQGELNEVKSKVLDYIKDKYFSEA